VYYSIVSYSNRVRKPEEKDFYAETSGVDVTIVLCWVAEQQDGTVRTVLCGLDQCFSTVEPRPGIGPWHQLNRAARSSTGICHFSFLSSFHEKMLYSGNIPRRIIFVSVSKDSDPDVGLRKLQYATRFH